jgi:tetratricopeptide (TPR) repeat protein
VKPPAHVKKAGPAGGNTTPPPVTRERLTAAPAARPAGHGRERLDPRFLLRLLLVAGLGALAWYGLHAWQNQRTAAALLDAANRARAEGKQKGEKVVRLLSAYLDRRPDDVEPRVLLAEVLTEQAQTAQQRREIIPLYAVVLARQPDRADLRRRLVKLATEAGRYEVAVEHLDILRRSAPDDVDLLEQLADCQAALDKAPQAKELYEQCLKRQPDRLELYIKVARLWLTRLGSPRDADTVLERMVAANRKSVRAWLERAAFRSRQGQQGEAERDVAEALALEPHNRSALFLGARLAGARADGESQARSYLLALIEHHPKVAQGYEALARLELSAGRPQEALRRLAQGLKELPQDPGLLWNRAYLLIQSGDMALAQDAVERSAARPVSEAHTAFLRAALEVRQGHWRAGREALEALRLRLAQSAEVRTQLDLLVGRCLERLADPSAAVLAYRRVVDAEPLNGPARLGLVSALLQQGRAERALEECRALVGLTRPPVAGWLILTRLLVLENFRRPAPQRQWQPVEDALRRAAAAAPDSDDVVIVRAQVLLARGDAGAARKVLEEARTQRPRKAVYRTALAELAQHEGRWADAEAILREAVAELGDGVELRLAQARLRAARAGAGLREALAKLEEGTRRWPEADRVLLLTELGQLYYHAGMRAEARHRWRRVAEMSPTDLTVRLLLFDLAYENDDEPGMRDALEAIRSVEGIGGALGRYNEARLLVHAGRKGHPEALDEARSLLTLVGRDRPDWSRVPLALAQIDELEGRQDSAIDNYQRAIRMGEKQLPVIRRVVELLFGRRRYAEADLVLRNLPDQAPDFGNLQRLAAQVKLEVGDPAQALEYARHAVPADSKSPADQRWLGEVLGAAGDAKGAEAALRRAVALAPGEADNWVALVQFLARNGHKDKAEAVLAEARTRLPAVGAELALAQAYAAIDRPEVARELFGAALKAHPEDAVALRTAADFYLRVQDLPRAEQCLRSLMALSGKDPAVARRARTMLAVVLAATGDHHRAREALVLLGLAGGRPPPAAEVGPAELRAQAVVLATQSSRRRLLEAVDKLKELDKRQPLTAEDRFVLAQLAERLEDRQLLHESMRGVLAADGANPRYLAYQVRILLREGSPGEAGRWLVVLESSHPQLPATAELKARVLRADGRDAEAAALLKDRADKVPAERLLIAGLLEELGQGAAAEELHRSYTSEKPDPERRLQLARYLGRQGRLDEALHICSDARATAAPEAVGYATLAVLHSGRPRPEQLAEARGWLEEAARQRPRSTGLLVCLADLADLRGRPGEAEAIYRRVLALEPHNAEALNNLAWLLALQEGRGDEALHLAEQAVEALGPLTEILDTRGLAHLACGQTEQAADDFRDAWRPGLRGRALASIRFHRAWALQRIGKHQEARAALQQARASGLQEDQLHPVERAAWEELAADLK